MPPPVLPPINQTKSIVSKVKRNSYRAAFLDVEYEDEDPGDAGASSQTPASWLDPLTPQEQEFFRPLSDTDAPVIDIERFRYRTEDDTAAAVNYASALTGAMIDAERNEVRRAVPPSSPRRGELDALATVLFDYLRGRQFVWKEGVFGNFADGVHDLYRELRGKPHTGISSLDERIREMNPTGGQLTAEEGALTLAKITGGLAINKTVSTFLFAKPGIGQILSLARVVWDLGLVANAALDRRKLSRAARELRASKLTRIAIGALNRLTHDRLKRETGKLAAHGLVGLTAFELTGAANAVANVALAILEMVQQLSYLTEMSARMENANTVLEKGTPDLLMQQFVEFPLLACYILPPAPPGATLGEKILHAFKPSAFRKRGEGPPIPKNVYLGYEIIGMEAASHAVESLAARTAAFDDLVKLAQIEKREAPCYLATREGGRPPEVDSLVRALFNRGKRQ